MKGILILIAVLGALAFALVVATATPNDKEEYEAYQRWKERNQTDKKEYCVADQLGTVCYHQSSELCQLCKRNEDDRKRLSQEIGIPITKRSRR